MQIELRPLSTLRPYTDNPRHNDDAVAAVAASIAAFGFRQPIVVDAQGVIVCGHTRFKAAQSLGLAQVPVHVALDLSPEQARAYRLADNQTASLATWDEAKLLEELLALEQSQVDLSVLGFSPEQLRDFLSPDPLAPGLGDPDEVPDSLVEAVLDPDRQPRTRPGDLWLLGPHRLLCGDATRPECVDRLLEDRPFDMLLSDPPYGVSYVGKTADALTLANDDLEEPALASLVRSAFDLAQRHGRPGAYWYASVPAGPLHLVFAEDWKRRGILRQILVWAKDTLVLGHSEYHYQHEPILFGWLPGPRHTNPDRTRTTLWQYDRPRANRLHPTMKPIALWVQATLDGSQPGERIYDPFLGSGTTLLAAQQTGRIGLGLEIEPRYCDAIVARWEQFTGLEATCQPDPTQVA